MCFTERRYSVLACHALSRENEEQYSCPGWAADAAMIPGHILQRFARNLYKLAAGSR